LQVIGGGLGRTGTLSLRKALDDLGFGPTYHGHHYEAGALTRANTATDARPPKRQAAGSSPAGGTFRRPAPPGLEPFPMAHVRAASPTSGPQQLEHQIGHAIPLPAIQQTHQVAVLKPAQEPGLGLESPNVRRAVPHHLERDRAVQHQIPGPVHVGHAPTRD
jgi:Sulfotransferase domain